MPEQRNESSAAQEQELRKKLARLHRLAKSFGSRVLIGDTYGCKNGPGGCLHMDAKKFLDRIEAFK